VIGIVGSKREARLKLMCELSTKLADEGYNVALVFRDEHEAVRPSKIFLIADELKTSTFVIVNTKLSLDDIKSFVPGKWCLILVEGHKADPNVIAATSEADLNEVGPNCIAIVPLSDEARGLVASWTSRAVDIDGAVKAIREVMLEDAMKLLALENCGKCGFINCRDLAQAIVKGEESPTRCAEKKEDVKLTVDGELVPLNQFASKVFVQVLRGLISILKGVPKNPRRILLEANLY
jgi:molybdopterin-guanine dinucleotide biosynthesis protein B